MMLSGAGPPSGSLSLLSTLTLTFGAPNGRSVTSSTATGAVLSSTNTVSLAGLFPKSAPPSIVTVPTVLVIVTVSKVMSGVIVQRQLSSPALFGPEEFGAAQAAVADPPCVVISYGAVGSSTGTVMLLPVCKLYVREPAAPLSMTLATPLPVSSRSNVTERNLAPGSSEPGRIVSDSLLAIWAHGLPFPLDELSFTPMP